MPRRAARAPRSVLMIGSEALPFAKTGGLADVLGALPSAVARLGWSRHGHAAALPRRRRRHAGRSRFPSPSAVGRARSASTRRRSPTARARGSSTVRSSTIARRRTASAPPTIPTTRAGSPCSCAPRSSSPRAAASGRRVVHAHDWQAGLAPVYLRTLYAGHPVLGGTPSVFTIHNLAYQGLFEPDWLPRLDLGWDELAIDRLEFWGRISFLKGGINDADRRHDGQPPLRRGDPDARVRVRLRRHPARAVRRSGRHPQRHRRRASGIPARDPFLPAPFSADDLSGKAAAKRALLARVRPARRRGRAGAAGRRDDFPHGRSEGVRSDRERRRRAAGARRRLRRARHGRGALPGSLDARSPRRIPIGSRRASGSTRRSRT